MDDMHAALAFVSALGRQMSPGPGTEKLQLADWGPGPGWRGVAAWTRSRAQQVLGPGLALGCRFMPLLPLYEVVP